MTTIQLNKITKKELIELYLKTKDEIKSVEDQKKAIELDLKITQTARKEDAEKVSKAQYVIESFQQREAELINGFKESYNNLGKEIQNQNDLIVSLFDMVEGTIKIQHLYFTKFKDIFLEDKRPKEE